MWKCLKEREKGLQGAGKGEKVKFTFKVTRNHHQKNGATTTLYIGKED